MNRSSRPRKSVGLFERRRSFRRLGVALAAAPLRNAYGFDGALYARRYVVLTQEAAISAVEFRRSAESAALNRACAPSAS